MAGLKDKSGTNCHSSPQNGCTEPFCFLLADLFLLKLNFYTEILQQQNVWGHYHFISNNHKTAHRKMKVTA